MLSTVDHSALKAPEEGHLGAWVALEALSENQREADEEDQEEPRRSQAEAWEEEALSYLEAQGELRETKRGVTICSIRNYCI